ncbi:tetratricopeptide repeat protein [Holophaga foetida]|uniref:tetratricopeptide repeat protein n=1 Tax=Holophaga foetida TaxID=35839 RepID=UPI0002474658|nr:tetratricopeptide repeat protein [Holophaga foetida]
MNTLPEYLETVLTGMRQVGPGESLARLQAAVEAHPEDPRLLLLLAGEYAQNREYDRAEGAYTAALLQAPDFAIARFQLGLLQFTSGRPSSALVTWVPLEILGRDHYLYLFKEGFAALAQDQFDEAIRCLEAGIRQNAENPPLNQDMQLMIQRIREARSETSSDGSDPSVEDPQADAHFLLSNYGKVQ